MEQHIKKSALVAEIKKLIKHSEMVADHNAQITELVNRELDTLYHLISFTNSLEVKEVDLREEIDVYFQKNKNGYNGLLICKKENFSVIARHFFELGLSVSNKAQKGE